MKGKHGYDPGMQRPKVEVCDYGEGPRISAIWRGPEDPSIDSYTLRIGPDMSHQDDRLLENLTMEDISMTFRDILDRYVTDRPQSEEENMDATNYRALQATRKQFYKASQTPGTQLLLKIEEGGSPRVNMDEKVRPHIRLRTEQIYDPQGHGHTPYFTEDGKISTQKTGWRLEETIHINLLDIVLALDNKGGRF